MRLLFLVSLSVGCKGDAPDTGPVLTPDTSDPGDPNDRDGDGWPDDEDCDPDDPYVHPGMDDIPYNGVDDDCGGDGDLTDVDGDGYDGGSEGDDCNDNNADISPGAPEICYDGLDNDCSGNEDTQDCDEDGFDRLDECNDEDPTIHPDATEIWYDGVDQDCDEQSDWDADGDGFDSSDEKKGGEDCDDTDGAIHPDADEVWYDDVDQDCAGDNDFDADGDGDDAEAYGGTDCDDDNAEDFGLYTWHADVDGDGFGSADDTTEACAEPSGYLEDASDCLDSDDAVNPDAEEICGDGIDQNCNASSDGCGVDGDYAAADLDSWVGLTEGDACGAGLAPGGDFDGDGVAEALVGCTGHDDGGEDGGAVGVLDLGSPNLAAATWILAEGGEDGVGAAASLGDFDGDGDEDFVVGAWTESTAAIGAGAVYMVAGPLTGNRSLADADKMVATDATDYLGLAVAGVGDLDGDGVTELLVGAPGSDLGEDEGGAAFLVTGASGLPSSTIDADLTLTGEGEDHEAGAAVASAGDQDGDGLLDLFIGAPSYGSGPEAVGAAYVVYATTAGIVDLASADASLTGEASGDRAGAALASVGDVDGDGTDDLLIGAPGESTAGADAGAAYLVLGPASGALPLGLADATITGIAGSEAGTSVGLAGDSDADGVPDLLIGAAADGGYGHVLLGPVSGTIDLSLTGARVAGSDTDAVGSAVLGPGDVDGDGYGDMLFGAPGADDGAGALFLFLGDGL